MSSERLHLLVADDERLARRLVRQYAAACSGIEVVRECADTASLSAALRAQPVDAALLDIRMPQVDGIEVLRQVKEDSELRKMPVIMLTTTDDPREVERCHKMGCASYIVKPVDFEQFVKAVSSAGLYWLLLNEVRHP